MEKQHKIIILSCTKLWLRIKEEFDTNQAHSSSDYRNIAMLLKKYKKMLLTETLLQLPLPKMNFWNSPDHTEKFVL